MKFFLFTLLYFIGLNSSAQTKEELIMIREINLIRSNPKSYIHVVEAYILELRKLDTLSKKFTLIKNKQTSIQLDNKENNHKITDSLNKNINDFYLKKIKDAEELIILLNNIKPMDTLVFNHKVYPITKKHSEYLKNNNVIGHSGYDNKRLHERVKPYNCSENVAYNKNNVLLLLLIDSSDDKRRHRNNILDKEVNEISVAINDFCVVQNFIKTN